MDALATRQLQRQKTAAIDNTKEASPGRSSESLASERLALNRLLGFPDPPSQVFAVGKDECAAVWWRTVEDESITDWEVHRFRKDKSKPELDIWHYKGFITFPNTLKSQTIVNNLTNDYEYRFTVKAVSAKGTGAESAPSNSVMVEKPLPTGWYRFVDKATKRSYYANIRLHMSSWTRPELDPWFLDEAILHNFNNREIEALKALYKEEMAHFKCVSVDQFMDVLREIGERCTKSWIIQLFQGYAGSSRALYSWKHFMEVINHIKQYRTGTTVAVKNPLEMILNFFNRKRIGAILQPKIDKLGDWVVEYSSLAERDYYYNSKTGESYWSMPPQVKFYIPPKLEDKLLLVFDYGDIEEFQQYFSLLDVDSSGDLSPKEIRILLKALDIQINELKFNKLIRTVDLNGNGKIEFDEYCWMMLQLYRKDNSEFWKEMRSRNKATKAIVAIPQEADGENSWSEGALGLSTGSLENSLFEDNAWDKKLTYDRMRSALDTMRQFTISGRRDSNRHNRFSLSSGAGGSFFGLSKQNSVHNNFSNGGIARPHLNWLCGCFGYNISRRNHDSHLNATLSKYDEENAEPSQPAQPTYYPPASIKPDLNQVPLTDANSSNPVGSLVGTIGSNKDIPQYSAARAGRRVSFTAGGPGGEMSKDIIRSEPPRASVSPSSASADRKQLSILAANSSVSLLSGEGSKPANSSRRRSSGSSKDENKVTKPHSKRSGRRKNSAVREEDSEDGVYGGEDEEDGGEDDNKSVVSFTSAASLMKRLIGRRKEGETDYNSKVHPKHCMCGCRAY